MEARNAENKVIFNENLLIFTLTGSVNEASSEAAVRSLQNPP